MRRLFQLTLKNGNLEAVPGKAGEEVVPEVHRLEVLEAAEDPGTQVRYAVPLQIHHLQRVLRDRICALKGHPLRKKFISSEVNLFSG